MQIKTFPHYIFWSYDPEADLPEEVIAGQVLQYGDLDDLFRLSEMVSHDTIAAVSQKIMANGHWLKRVNFINKVILGR